MAIARVQSATGTVAPGTSLSATFGTPATANNLLIIASNSASSLSGTPSGWTAGVPLNTLNNFCATNVFYKVAAGGETGGTVTLAASDRGGIVIAEYSGITTTSPLDKVATSNPGTFASTIASGTTATTTQADELLICVFGSIRVSTPANSFTAFTNSFALVAQIGATGGDADQVAIAERIVSAPGTYSSTATMSGAENRPLGAIVTFKAAAAGGGPTVKPLAALGVG